MKELVKLYMFYQVFDNGISPRFYAHTIEKDIAKKFEDQRDNKQFHKIVKEVPYSEYKSFANTHESLRLHEVTLLTSSENDDDGMFYYGKGQPQNKVKIILTNNEEMEIFTKSDLIFQDIMKSDFVNTYIFDNEIRELIENTFHYTRCFELYHIKNGIILSDAFIDWSDDRYDPFSEFVIDQLAIFLFLYGHTLKSE